MAQRVFVDANVLFSRTLYDWLFLLRIESDDELFRIHTSWDVINEAGAKLRDQNPEWKGSTISTLMSKIQENFDEIITDYPGGPVAGIGDEGDWHVHHAAESSRADILLTNDVGFESEDTHYEVYNCDDFFVQIDKVSPNLVRTVAREQADYWARRNGKQLNEALKAAGCPGFAELVLEHLKVLARARG